MQPGLLDGDVLQMVDLRRVGQAEHATDAGLGVGVGHLAVGQQLDLLQLLLQRHPAQQVIHPLFDLLTGGDARRLQGGLVGGRVRCGDTPGYAWHQGDHGQTGDQGTVVLRIGLRCALMWNSTSSGSHKTERNSPSTRSAPLRKTRGHDSWTGPRARVPCGQANALKLHRTGLRLRVDAVDQKRSPGARGASGSSGDHRASSTVEQDGQRSAP